MPARKITRPVTEAEQEWIDQVAELLSNPPSDRLGLFTIGDPFMTVYDKSRDEELDTIDDHDFCVAVEMLGAELGVIDAAMNIHSTSG